MAGTHTLWLLVGGEDDPGKYNIVFTLDSDVRTSITIYYLATEEVGSDQFFLQPINIKK